MENIVFDRNYELVSENNSFADVVFKQVTAPDGFFASYYNKFGQESRAASPAFPPSRA